MLSKATRAVMAAGENGFMASVRRLDGFVNFATGLGDARRDKRMHAHPSMPVLLDDLTLEALWTDNDIVRRGVKTLPSRALKMGFRWQNRGKDVDADTAADDANELQKACTRWRIRPKVLQAACWGRLFGRGVIFIGALGSGNPEDPLEPERVTKLLYFKVLDRRDLMPYEYYDDPNEDKFGEIKTWLIQPSGLPVASGFPVVAVHETRLLSFGGDMTSMRAQHRNHGSENSVVQAPYSVVRDFISAHDGVGHLMQDVSQSVFKIKNLMELIAAGKQDALNMRMELTDMVRSMVRAVLLDADSESFERITASLAGIPETLDRFAERLAAAWEMPLTLLMGRSPAGMNATGESDIRLFYDTVIEYQREVIGPALEFLGRLIAQVEGIGSGDVEDWHVVFPTPWRRNAAEEAAHKTALGTYVTALINAGVVLPEEVALSLFGTPDNTEGELTVDLAARRKALKVALVQMAEGPPPPVALPPGSVGPIPPTGGSRAPKPGNASGKPAAAPGNAPGADPAAAAAAA